MQMKPARARRSRRALQRRSPAPRARGALPIAVVYVCCRDTGAPLLFRYMHHPLLTNASEPHTPHRLLTGRRRREGERALLTRRGRSSRSRSSRRGVNIDRPQQLAAPNPYNKQRLQGECMHAFVDDGSDRPTLLSSSSRSAAAVLLCVCREKREPQLPPTTHPHHRLRAFLASILPLHTHSQTHTHTKTPRMEKVNVLSGEIQRTWVWQSKVRVRPRELGRASTDSIPPAQGW